ncbi:MAG: hypothetical protein R6U17_04890 [Thermoplasmata archaeon]
MAKRRRKKEEEEEDIDFEFPEFDRVEYMKKEINKGKTILVSIGLAPVFSFLSLQVFELTGETSMGFMVGIFGMLLTLKVFEFLPIDLSGFGKKEWAMNGAMYFFTWLGIWILLMNPPFGDFSDPVLNSFEIHVETDGNWTAIEEANLTHGGEYNIRAVAKVTDNVAVDEENVTIRVIELNKEEQMDTIGDHEYEVVFNETVVEHRQWEIVMSMKDVNGNTNTETKIVSINV